MSQELKQRAAEVQSMASRILAPLDHPKEFADQVLTFLEDHEDYSVQALGIAISTWVNHTVYGNKSRTEAHEEIDETFKTKYGRNLIISYGAATPAAKLVFGTFDSFARKIVPKKKQ